jgi:hypothetical protein
VEERRPESARRHGPLEVGIGGGDQAHVDAADLVADRLDLAALQDAQQQGLDLGRSLPHLVEEEGAAVGALEVAVALAVRAGVGAADGAEQLGRREGGRDRRHVDREVGPRAARTALVQGAGDQLLAGAGLAAQEHRHVEAGDALDLAAQDDHGRALADEAEIRCSGRAHGIEPGEQEDDPIGEEKDHAPLQALRRHLQLIRDRLAVRHDRGAALAADHAHAARRPGQQPEGPAAQVRIAKRAQSAAARLRESGLAARQQLLPA